MHYRNGAIASFRLIVTLVRFFRLNNILRQVLDRTYLDSIEQDLLSRSQVAAIFQVSPTTVNRWGKEGKLPSVQNPSGHRRYPRGAVEQLARKLTSVQSGATLSTGRAIELNNPIDVMFLMHKAFRVLSMQVERQALGLEYGGDVHAFKKNFRFWGDQLFYHAASEDKYMTASLKNSQGARNNETEHAVLAKQAGELVGFLKAGETAGLGESVKSVMISLEETQHEEVVAKLEEVEEVLRTELGGDNVAARTKRHLYSRVVALRVAEFDHFENEEAFVVPEIRERMNEEEQLSIVKHLLIDEGAKDPSWIIDWVFDELSPRDQSILTAIKARF